MSNIYKDFFETLKNYLIELEIDDVYGCTDDEIQTIRDKYTVLPLAYEEYLRTIGKKFLFSFMDAEDMAFDDLGYIWEVGENAFSNNKKAITEPHIIISERRNDYVSLIYLNESANPKVWIMDCYWDEEDDGENLVVRANSFTDLMISFFSQTLVNHPFGFHWVTKEEKEENSNIIQDRYKKWLTGLATINQRIKSSNNDNEITDKLNRAFIDYYISNEQSSSLDLVEDQVTNEAESATLKTHKNIIQKFLAYFRP